MLYRARARTTLTPTAANGILCAVRPGIRPVDLLELRLILRNVPAMTAAPTAGFAVGIMRSTAIGITPTTQLGVTLKSTAGQEAAGGGIATTWATPPTLGSSVMLDSAVGGTQLGYPVVFAWDRLAMLELGDSSQADGELVLVLSEAHTTAPIFDVIATWDE